MKGIEYVYLSENQNPIYVVQGERELIQGIECLQDCWKDQRRERKAGAGSHIHC